MKTILTPFFVAVTVLILANLNLAGAQQAVPPETGETIPESVAPESAVEAVAVDPSEQIRYSVDLSDVKNHYVTVHVEAPANGDKTQLMMAVWTPGSYLVREYARNVDSFEAFDDEGGPLGFEKVRKNRWEIETAGLETFHVRYRVYCRELSVRTNFVNSEYAVLNGAPTFLTIAELREKQHVVTLELPENWKRSASAMELSAKESHSFVADSFDQLVDSPIVAGNVNLYPFKVNDIQHYLVNVGEQGMWDGAAAATDLAKIVAAQHEIWDVVPYKEYKFINVIGGGGGLEHDNCCLMMTGRWSFRDPSRYKRWLTLASHEFFHTWNIRRLKPRSLVKYDYENEVYTRSLWVAEGVTSYYENLAMLRAGLVSRSDFIGSLSSDIGSVQNTPGRKRQSLKESSYDAWIKFYRPDSNSSNTRISYYSKGAVVAFLLDAKIRQITNGDKSLDDVMRAMWAAYSEVGYIPSEFRQVVTDVCGEDLSDWFHGAVDSTDELEFNEMLDLFGMDFVGRPRVSESDVAESDSDTEKSKATSESKKKPYLGVRASDGKISRVTDNSPATRAGFNLDDELIAVNGFRLSGDVERYVEKYDVGEQLDVLIARAGRMMTVPVILEAKPNTSWKLKFNRKPTEDQQDQRDRWMGAEDDGKSEADAKPVATQPGS